jgi:hypothetical protein
VTILAIVALIMFVLGCAAFVGIIVAFGKKGGR